MILNDTAKMDIGHSVLFIAYVQIGIRPSVIQFHHQNIVLFFLIFWQKLWRRPHIWPEIRNQKYTVTDVRTTRYQSTIYSYA